jgi:hypothetical protein
VVAHILLYAASALVSAWGLAHLVPTRAVVAGFGPISVDNRRVLTMEWVAEGITMLFVGVVWFKACPFVMAVCVGLILVESSL